MAVRFAVVGCGHITRRLALPQLAACRQAEVVALVDKQYATARRAADQFGIDRRRIWTDWKRMLREAEADAVAVNLPNTLHAEVAIAALRAKKHVMVEKPMALTLTEADAMIGAAQANRRLLMVEQTQRFHPTHETAHAILRRGVLGRVRQLRGRIGHAGPEYWAGTARSWLTDRRRSGGGALMDVGVHIADLLAWLSGKRVTRVCCQIARIQKRFAVEDSAAALLEFTDGAIGEFEASWATRPYEVSTHFYGDRGRLWTDLGAARPLGVQLCRRAGDPNQPDGAVRHPDVPSSSRLGGAYPSFVESIARGHVPAVPGEEGRHALAVILAAYESARAGCWVEL